MKNSEKGSTRREALSAALVLGLGISSPLYAGIPKGGNNTDKGPYGLPALKKVVEACSLTHDQEQLVLRIYNEYKHREHEELQAKETKGSTDGRGDCINAVKQVLMPDQQKKFDDLLGEGKKKKKT